MTTAPEVPKDAPMPQKQMHVAETPAHQLAAEPVACTPTPHHQGPSPAIPDIKVLHHQAKESARKNELQESSRLYSDLLAAYNNHVLPNEPFHLTLGEVWFEYGKVLFDLAVLEGGIFGTKGEQVVAAGVEAAAAAEEDDEDSQWEEDGEEEEEYEEDGEEEAEGQEDGEQEPMLQQTNTTDDFETAWEALELSRLIYTLHLPQEVVPFIPPLEMRPEYGSIAQLTAAAQIVDAKLKLAEVYLMLADLSLEQDNYKQALDDLNVALMIKKSLIPLETDAELKNVPWDIARHMAEVYFKIAMAYEFEEDFEESFKQLKLAIDIMRAFVDVLQKSLTSAEQADVKGKGKATAASPFNLNILLGLAEKPINWIEVVSKVDENERCLSADEINSLVPELESKLEDLGEQVKNALKKREMEKMQPIEEEGFGKSKYVFGQQQGSSVATPAVQDLSTLVKKKPIAEKRKAEEEPEVEKKPKTEA